jgi:hypothetical protein
MGEWSLHRQPHDCIADHEYSFWVDGEIVVLANSVPGHAEKIDLIVKAVNAHAALVKALEEIEDLGANGATAARLGNIAHAALIALRIPVGSVHE